MRPPRLPAEATPLGSGPSLGQALMQGELVLLQHSLGLGTGLSPHGGCSLPPQQPRLRVLRVLLTWGAVGMNPVLADGEVLRLLVLTKCGVGRLSSCSPLTGRDLLLDARS